MFEKWHKDDRYVYSIILASMTNEIQKQYGRLDVVGSIMLRIKRVYVASNQYIGYAAAEAIFKAKMIEGYLYMNVGISTLVLDWETSTSRTKCKGAKCWNRKKDGAESTTANALSAPIALLGEDKGNRKMVRWFRSSSPFSIDGSDWYVDLVSESTDDWDEMEKKFLNCYNTSRMVSMVELTNARQWKDEPVIDYINCWHTLCLN
ncbi:UNVERIFIED_CONTAM: hypothetical protein Scaly_0085400 [Sesamum calycinum]|uniref:Uncharacterized protein n=1 Tax=Sesamum calycinum TaxID=2727403 RepID=A0AAW2SV99_9LAMI